MKNKGYREGARKKVLTLTHQSTGSLPKGIGASPTGIPVPPLRRYREGNVNYYSGGFTFIEMLIYIGIIGMMMATLVPSALEMISGQTESNNNSEMYSQVRKISDRIKYEIRNASGINSVTTQSISLASSVAGNNPTIIDQSGAFIRIKQGAGAVINLNSSDSTVSGLVFTNFTSGDNKTKNIQFTFTLLQNYSSVRNEYTGSSSIEGAAEVRSN